MGQLVGAPQFVGGRPSQETDCAAGLDHQEPFAREKLVSAVAALAAAAERSKGDSGRHGSAKEAHEKHTAPSVEVECPPASDAAPSVEVECPPASDLAFDDH